jgi:hypothetical protein
MKFHIKCVINLTKIIKNHFQDLMLSLFFKFEIFNIKNLK